MIRQNNKNIVKYHLTDKKNGTIVTQTVCAVLFTVFSFLWLYWFQADVLYVAQHVLSRGHTHYNRLVGALLIIGVLMFLQQIVMAVVRLRRRTHALTYFPSMLVLAYITDVEQALQHGFSRWTWLLPVLLVLWGGMVWLAKQMMPFDVEKQPTGLLSRRVWINTLLMALMMLGVAALANTHAVFHFRAHAEVALLHNDFDEALRVGRRSHETDASLTMLRAYALARQGLMGERLFEYPVAGKGKDLMPFADSSSKLLVMKADSLYRCCGAMPVGVKTAKRYFYLLEKDSLATKAVADYRLCGMLIDRKIDEFARTITRYYGIGDALPRHYREALTLYTHLRSQPVAVYKHAVLDEDWADMQKLKSKYPDEKERKNRVAERYFGSYWYYYFYGK